MTEETKERCTNCKFVIKAWMNPNGHQPMECHRYPPMNGDFPTVAPSSWCGEFQPFQPPNPEEDAERCGVCKTLLTCDCGIPPKPTQLAELLAAATVAAACLRRKGFSSTGERLQVAVEAFEGARK